MAARSIAVLMMLALTAAGAAHAGGVYLYELDAASTSLASAGWTARAEDAGPSFSNPAGMARLGDGALQVSLLPLYLHTQFSPDPARTTAVLGLDESYAYRTASGRDLGVTAMLATSSMFAGAFADVFAVPITRRSSWRLGAEAGLHRISPRYASFDLFPPCTTRSSRRRAACSFRTRAPGCR